VPPAKGVVRLIPADNAVLVDVGQPLTPEQARAWRAARGIPELNRPLVPTAEEVARLPRLARLAFTVRCAARMQPLLPAPVAELDPQAAAALIVGAATVNTPLARQLRCLRRDFDRLVYLAKKRKWTDETPVPPEVFGPMWPEALTPSWASAPK
jgi:hypothetical protein